MSFTPLLLHHFTPLGSPMQPKKRKSFELHFSKKILPLQPHSYIILPPWHLCTLSCVALTSRPSIIVQLLTVDLYEQYLLELPLSTIYPLILTSSYPLRTNYSLTLTPFYPPWQTNSCIILPPLNNLPTHSYTILPPLAAPLLHHFTTLGSPTVTSFYPTNLTLF